MGVPLNYVEKKHERERAIQRARERAEAAVEEREGLRLEIRTREILHEIDAIGNYDFQGDRGAMAQAKIHLEAKKILLDRVLPTLKSVDMDSILSQAQEHVSLVQVVRFDNGEALAHLDPTGHTLEHEAQDPNPHLTPERERELRRRLDLDPDLDPELHPAPAPAPAPRAPTEHERKIDKLRRMVTPEPNWEPNPLVDTTVIKTSTKRPSGKTQNVYEVQPPASVYCRSEDPTPGKTALADALRTPEDRRHEAHMTLILARAEATRVANKEKIREIERQAADQMKYKRTGPLPPLIVDPSTIKPGPPAYHGPVHPDDVDMDEVFFLGPNPEAVLVDVARQMALSDEELAEEIRAEDEALEDAEMEEAFGPLVTLHVPNSNDKVH